VNIIFHQNFYRLKILKKRKKKKKKEEKILLLVSEHSSQMWEQNVVDYFSK